MASVEVKPLTAKQLARAVDRANVVADESQHLVTDQAARTLRDDFRVTVKRWLKDARAFFPDGKKQWSLQHVRQERLPIRHATEDLAHQLGTIYLRVARAARRAAFARAYAVSKQQQVKLLGKAPDPVDVLADAGAARIG